MHSQGGHPGVTGLDPALRYWLLKYTDEHHVPEAAAELWRGTGAAEVIKIAGTEGFVFSESIWSNEKRFFRVVEKGGADVSGSAARGRSLVPSLLLSLGALLYTSLMRL